MKNTFVFFLILLLMFVHNIFTQESGKSGDSELSIGGGIEWNMNSRENFAAAVSASIDYNLPFFTLPLSAGATFIYSNNFYGFSVVEIAGTFRWYFLSSGFTGFFAQADLGTYIFMEDSSTTPLFLGGLRGGFRLPIGNFYIEPYGRLGFPFTFGLGIIGGISLQPVRANGITTE